MGKPLANNETVNPAHKFTVEGQFAQTRLDREFPDAGVINQNLLGLNGQLDLSLAGQSGIAVSKPEERVGIKQQLRGLSSLNSSKDASKSGAIGSTELLPLPNLRFGLRNVTGLISATRKPCRVM